MPVRANHLVQGDKSSQSISPVILSNRLTGQPLRKSGGGQPLDPGRASPAPAGALPLRPPPQPGPVRLSGSRACPPAPRRPLSAAWPNAPQNKSGGLSWPPLCTARRYYSHSSPTPTGYSSLSGNRCASPNPSPGPPKPCALPHRHRLSAARRCSSICVAILASTLLA